MLIRSKARHVWHSPKFVLERGDNRVEAIPPQALKRIRQLAESREIDILGDALPLPGPAEAQEQYSAVKSNEQLRELVSERNAEVAELQRKLGEATDKVKELSVQVDSLEQENQALTARLAELEPPASEQPEAGDDHAESEGDPDAEGRHKHGKRKR